MLEMKTCIQNTFGS